MDAKKCVKMTSNATISNGKHYLDRINLSISTHPSFSANTHRLDPIWAEHTRRVHRRLPEAVIEADGQILHTGQLSPGCRACKAGAWDCVFITGQCNLSCPFCTLPPNEKSRHYGAAYGRTPEEFIENISRARKPLRGVGFTGGEALLEPQRLFRWITGIRKARPDLYLWLYTNGLTATPDRLKHLRQLGVDEIRFNMAATGYTHPLAMSHLECAAGLFQATTVEIPAIPGHGPQLRNALPLWASAGTKYLNLHELMGEPNSPSKQLSGDIFPWVTPDGHHTDLHLESRSLVLDIMETVTHENIPLWVNDCSSQSNLLQIIGRRRQLLPLVKHSFEKLEHNHFLSHVCALGPANTASLIHPENWATCKDRLQDHRWYKIQRTAPLSVNEPARWTRLEELYRGQPDTRV